MEHMDLSRLDPWMDFCWLQLYTKTEEPVAATRWIRFIYRYCTLHNIFDYIYMYILVHTIHMGLFLTDVGTPEPETEQLLVKNPMHHSNCWVLPCRIHGCKPYPVFIANARPLVVWWSNPTTKQQQQTQPFAGHVG